LLLILSHARTGRFRRFNLRLDKRAQSSYFSAMQKNDALQRIRRFYKTVEARPADGGFEILLDGRKAKTPAGAAIALPTQAAGELVASEWADQAPWIEFGQMPATRHAFTAIDRVSGAHAETAAELARFAASDLLCYFAENPQALIERQQTQWGPVLDWAEDELGLLFVRAQGVVYQVQPPQTVHQVEALALELDDFTLAGLAWAAALFGSSVLALALQRGRLTGEEAFELSRLDEAFQNEQWGEDAEATERTAGMRREAVMLERWFAALR
jgi:chaperone required for assembly of F1-ATPase